jgi:hypothetical protein
VDGQALYIGNGFSRCFVTEIVESDVLDLCETHKTGKHLQLTSRSLLQQFTHPRRTRLALQEGDKRGCIQQESMLPPAKRP